MEASPPTPPAAPGDEDARCPPCRGTGKVVSNLGGTAQQVDCPWCEGTGVPIPEHDAQARWREGDSAGSGEGESAGDGEGGGDSAEAASA